ncbi:MAG: hypothetical protein WAT18_02245 [Sphingorhabdus sp.]|uniref:hypothetical protein n=1 Tax=Sphingorhabdus sp. TaxID=1902408 RepID=UPI003BB04B86|nr:hypothetical protein [Sphingomonadales bacterium]
MIGFLDFIYKLGLGAALGIVAAQYIGDIDGLGDFLAIFSLTWSISFFAKLFLEKRQSGLMSNG